MDQFKYANKSEQVKNINKYMSTSMIIFDALIMLVVCISVLHGNRSFLYSCIVGVTMLITIVTCLVMVKRNPGTGKMRYVAFVGLFLIMFFISFAYNDYYMRFMTVVPFLGIVFYFDKKYSTICANGIAIPSVAIFLYRAFLAKNYTNDDMLA